MLKKSIWLNLLIMLAIVVSGFFLVVWSLDYYTKHGEAVVIPELRGKQLTEGEGILERADLRYEVVDSIYDKTAVPGSIIETYPKAGESVKPGRIIFLKVYATSPPRIAIPHLKDMSSRQAYALLRALGFENITQKQVVGEYMGLCQGITLSNGQQLKAGDLIGKDTPLVLLVTGEVQLDSIRLEELLAADSLAEEASALTIGDSVKRKEPVVPEDTPDTEPEQFW